MSDTLKVRATLGRVCPHAPGKLGFVGYQLVSAGEQADHVIPGGGSFRAIGAVEVPDNSYYRRAIRRGDIQQVEAEEASKPRRARAESEG